MAKKLQVILSVFFKNKTEINWNSLGFTIKYLLVLLYSLTDFVSLIMKKLSNVKTRFS